MPADSQGENCDGTCKKCDGSKNCVNQAAGEDLFDQCVSGTCKAGVCDGAGSCSFSAAGTQEPGCTSFCSGCDGSGNCGPIPAGLDPNDDCAATVQQTGFCDGAYNCEEYPPCAAIPNGGSGSNSYTSGCTGSSVSPGGTCTLTCNTGGYSGSVTRTCHEGAWTTESLTCSPNSCGPIPNGGSGSSAYTTNCQSGNTAHNGQCTLSCSAVGYDGSVQRTCTAGTWSSQTPSCTPADCPPIAAGGSGSGAYSTTCQSAPTPSSDTCTLTCSTAGYMGSVNRLCTTGSWSSDSLVCTATRCTDAPAAPTDGAVSFTDGDNHGSQAHFTCNTGYYPSGSETLTCSAVSSNTPWPASDMQCLSTACTSPPTAPSGGSVSFSDGNADGSVATFSCDIGHAQSGTTTITCSAPTSSQPWPTPPATPTCTPTLCSDAPAAPTNGDVSFSDGNGHASVATFSCNSGYVNDGDTSVTCSAPTANSVWPAATPNCIDEPGCAGHSCNSDGDAGATCVDANPPSTGYTCSCTPGYEVSAGVCVDIDGCSGNSCGTTDSGATCSDLPPPSTGYTCVCTAGYGVDDGGAATTCTACTTQSGCVVDLSTCVSDTLLLACDTSVDGTFVDVDGIVTECEETCATCTSASACTSCLASNADISGDTGLCVCADGFYGNGVSCFETNPCEDNPCDASDVDATCSVVDADTYSCSCSAGYSEVAGTCSDPNGCVGAACDSLGDASASCADVAAPGDGYTCTCSTRFFFDGTACAACPASCAACSSATVCTACANSNAVLASDGSACSCRAGYHGDGATCQSCNEAIPGCASCSSATSCQSCQFGDLSDDGSACNQADGGQVVDNSDAGEEASESGAGAVIGAVVAVLCCIIVVLAVVAILAVTRSRKQSNGKKYAAKTGTPGTDATVVFDQGSFGTYLRAQIEKTEPFADGGFGAVYRINLENGQEVALKVLDASASESAKAEFHREVSILTKLTVLDSSMIVHMLCFCEDPICMGMEYAPNGTLLEEMKKGPIAGERLQKVLTDTARPIAFLHEQGIAHWDVKPQNFLIMKDERIVICDFGLSVEVSNVVPIAAGTPQYLAPERYQTMASSQAILSSVASAPEKSADPKLADVFSWGIMTTAFTTGKVPFSQYSVSNIASLIAEQQYRPSHPKDTPEWLVNLSVECWSHDPSNRPAMAHVVKLVEGQGIAADDSATVVFPNPAFNENESMQSQAMFPVFEQQNTAPPTPASASIGESNQIQPPPPVPELQ